MQQKHAFFLLVKAWHLHYSQCNPTADSSVVYSGVLASTRDEERATERATEQTTERAERATERATELGLVSLQTSNLFSAPTNFTLRYVT